MLSNRAIARFHQQAKGQPATIEEAFKELSRRAFAVWIRMMVTPPDKLRGLARMSKMLGCSSRNLRTVLTELRFKNFIELVRLKEGRRGFLEVKLTRRAMLVGADHFIKLSNFLFSGIENIESNLIQDSDPSSVKSAAGVETSRSICQVHGEPVHRYKQFP